MSGFIKEKQFFKYFPDNDFPIIYVGYDDFSFVKPVDAFYVQAQYALHFVISGKGSYEIDNKRYEIKKGDMFMVPADTKMRYFPDENDPWEYVWFSIKRENGAVYERILGLDKLHTAKCVSFGEITAILKDLIENLNSENGSYFNALSAFYKIMAICTRKTRLTGVQAAKKYIDDSFTLSEFSVQRITTEIGISHAQLLRSFKREYGTTVIKYVIKKRIELACELLKNTDLTIKSVAYSCGFTDEAHFMKTFKKEMGVTAGEYKS